VQAAQAELDNLKRHRNGLEEWQNLLQHDEAAALKAVLAEDVQLAEDLIAGKAVLETLTS
jgi:hypothetical protein